MVALFVMPTSLIVEILNYYPFNPMVCTIWISLDVLCCTSSIHHMSTMALDRFLTIKFPLKYGRNKSKRIALVKICFIWFISLCLCSPLIILGLLDNSNVFEIKTKQCILSNKNFKLYGSIFAFYIPFVIMVIAYVKTIHILKNILDKKLYEKNYKISELEFKTTASEKKIDKFLIGNNMFNKNKSNMIHLRKNLSKSVGQIETFMNLVKYENIHESRGKNYSENILNMSKNNRQQTEMKQDLKANFKDYPSTFTMNIQKLRELRSSSFSFEYSNKIILDSDKNKKASTESNNGIKKYLKSNYQNIKNVANNERKALRVLIIMFTVFATLWSPFFILNTLSVLFEDLTKILLSKYEKLIYSLLTWLGYVSSMANPIVYTMFNKTFRTAFLNVFLCKRKYSKLNFKSDKLKKHRIPKICNYSFNKKSVFSTTEIISIVKI